MQTTLEIITGIFARLLKKPGLKLEMNDSPDTVAGWDSLTHPELITEVEQCFEIEFDFKELAGIKSIADLVQLTDLKQNKNSK
jgi:acyl carrier protein